MRNTLMIISSILLSCFTTQAQHVIDKIVAQVGGEIVLLSDVEKSMSFLADTYGEVDDDTRCFVIQDIMSQKLLVNQAKLDSILVTEEEIKLQLDARLNQILAAMNFDEDRFEEYYGKSVDDVRREQRENIENKLLSDRMRSNVMADVEATPSEVVEFFNKIPKDSLPYFNSEVEISEIVYKIPYSQEEKDAALNKLVDIREKVLSEEAKFEDLAVRNSDDPGSRKVGGELGWAKRGTYVPEFEATVYNLEIGEYSEIIETQFGYHFIQLMDRLGENVQVRHILIKPDLTAEDVTQAEVFMDSLRRLIKADSLTFEEAVQEYGDPDQQSYNNGGRVVNQKTGNTFFEIGELDSDIYFAVNDLEVGDLSEPILIEQPGSDPLYKVYKLVSRTPPHRASLETDYARIQQFASEDKKVRMFQDWLIDRIENTYIEVEENYLQCPNIEDWVN